MKKVYSFEKGKWSESDFQYVYSLLCSEYKTFTQEQDCIRSDKGNCTFGYEYISMLTREKYRSGVKFSTRCDFHKFGAPLLVLTDDIHENKDGKTVYGVHFEAVAFEEGCNVWLVEPAPAGGNSPVKPTLLAKPKFPIADLESIDISVEVKGKTLAVEVNGHKFEVTNERIPEEFYVGITACEGINRFYHLTIENDD